jgi:1-acyl-sn-glycerol-3-phosphate acyltransferase
MLKQIGYALYSVYFILIAIATYILFSIPIQIAYPFLGSKKHEYYAFFSKMWAVSILVLTGLLPKVHGKWPKDKGPYIYLFNHQSQLDILIALAVLPVGFKFVAKEELFKIPFLGDSLRKNGYISIKRQQAREAAAALEKVKSAIDKGLSILIFPEGTRTVTGEIGAIKRGSIMVAFETKTPLLPAIINPAHLIMPKGSYFLRPRRIHLQIGAPIILDWENQTRDYTIESAAKIESMLKAQLQQIA